MHKTGFFRGIVFLFFVVLLTAPTVRAQLVPNAGGSHLTVTYEEDDYINGLGAADRNFDLVDFNGPPWAPNVQVGWAGGPSPAAGSYGQGAATWGVNAGGEFLTMPAFSTGLVQPAVPPGGAAAGAQAKMTILTRNMFNVPGGGAAVPAHPMNLSWPVYAVVFGQPPGTPPAGVGNEHASFRATVKYSVNGLPADLDPVLGGVQDTSTIFYSTPLGAPGVYFQSLLQAYTSPALVPGDQLVIDSTIIFEGDPASISMVPEPASAALIGLIGFIVRRRRS